MRISSRAEFTRLHSCLKAPVLLSVIDVLHSLGVFITFDGSVPAEETEQVSKWQDNRDSHP